MAIAATCSLPVSSALHRPRGWGVPTCSHEVRTCTRRFASPLKGSSGRSRQTGSHRCLTISTITTITTTTRSAHSHRRTHSKIDGRHLRWPCHLPGLCPRAATSSFELPLAELSVAREPHRESVGAAVFRALRRGANSPRFSRSFVIRSGRRGISTCNLALPPSRRPSSRAAWYSALASSFPSLPLHLETVRFLRGLYTSHLTHHKLTSIRFDQTGRVKSAYAITDQASDDQSTFPPWALIPFFAFFTPFFAPMAFSFPRIPILISGYAAIAIAHFLYETIHAIHHQPYDACWRARLDRQWSGRFWRWLYGFHQAHHANHRCNLNVAGFFGIPLADLLFGTYKQPSPLLIDGARATNAAARALSSQPHWPIS